MGPYQVTEATVKVDKVVKVDIPSKGESNWWHKRQCRLVEPPTERSVTHIEDHLVSLGEQGEKVKK